MKEKEINPIELKRTHAKPYKVGKLYFGRSGTTRGSNWVVSRSVDLSDPLDTFEVGKQARAYCEDVRDVTVIPRDVVPAEIDVNIPAGTGLTNIFDDVADVNIV
jgi:hypothetical protein